jgi:hypothetical protein
MTTTTDITDTEYLAERIAEARAIHDERSRRERESVALGIATRGETARIRAEKIEAGLLGECPVCAHEVDTGDGIGLVHGDQWDRGYCLGVGAPFRPIGITPF